MNHNTNDLDHDQTEEEETLTCEVSDDALEAASGTSRNQVGGSIIMTKLLGL